MFELNRREQTKYNQLNQRGLRFKSTRKEMMFLRHI